MSKNERVKIWNSFLELARDQAEMLSKVSNGEKTSRNSMLKGGALPYEKHHVLALLLLCNLAIEARANHLIHELQERGKITEKVAEAALWLPTEHKWFFLPILAKTSTKIKTDQPPHQAISQICGYRNDLIHVRYAKLNKKPLPTPRNMISLYNNFVRAMENMNVIIKGIRKERKTVLKKLIV